MRLDPSSASITVHRDATPLALRHRLRLALASLELAQASCSPWALAEAHREAAGAYAAVGAMRSALGMLEQALRWASATGSADQRVDLLCEIVETLAAESDAMERQRPGTGRASRDQARDRVFEASQLAARVADARWEVTVLLRLSDVLDRFGDRDDATQLQMRALLLTVGGSPEAPKAADAALYRAKNGGRNRVETVGKSSLLTVGKQLRVEAADEIALVVGAASLVLKKDGSIVLKGKNIDLIGAGKINVKASGDLTLKGSKIVDN